MIDTPDSSSSDRPTLGLPGGHEVVREFVAELQAAIDIGDAVGFNRRFASDILWGSPFGAIAEGYELIHSIHARMFASVAATPGAARYDIEKVRQLAPDVIAAYIRRIATNRPSDSASKTPDTSAPGAFDELALIVLVQKNNQWWLATAQHVPDRRDVYAR